MKNKYIILVIALLFIVSCYSKPIVTLTLNGSESYNNNELNEAVEIIEVVTPQRFTVNFIATGDNLFHLSVITSSLIDGVYDFSPIYSEVKSIIENADLSFINQETVMAGTSFGYTGYPLFNTPQSLGYTLAETGFDIVNLANNHAMDMRTAGLYATLDFLDTIEELTIIGARREGESARIVTKNNITFGFLAYTFSLNGIPLPRDNPNLVSMINRSVMTEEIQALRPLCDFLIVSMHWGDEYRLQPGADQTGLAMFLAELDVDIIIGHHPHVLQRVETITLPNGRQTICFYSLGNFVSHQRERERLIGGIAAITFKKEGFFCESGEFQGELSITDFGMIPVVTHYDRNFRNTKIYPLYAYSEELLENHGFRRFDSNFTMEFLYSVLNRLQTNVIMEFPY